MRTLHKYVTLFVGWTYGYAKAYGRMVRLLVRLGDMHPAVLGSLDGLSQLAAWEVRT